MIDSARQCSPTFKRSNSSQPLQPQRAWSTTCSESSSQLGEHTYFEPAQRAENYNLLAETPGFNLVANVKDAIGRVGVGIEWQFKGGAGELIFNPTTYALLGSRTWLGAPDQSVPSCDGGALLTMAIVNQAGQVPSTAG